jgi:hypothetical protein
VAAVLVASVDGLGIPRRMGRRARNRPPQHDPNAYRYSANWVFRQVLARRAAAAGAGLARHLSAPSLPSAG